MATSPEGIMALGQPAEAGGPPASPNLITRNDSYDVAKQALTESRPDVAAELEDRLAGFRKKARQLPADVLEALVDGFEEALNRKDDYPAFLEEVKKEAPALLSLFPPEYDEQFLSAMYFLLVDALRAREGEEDVGEEGIGAMAPQQFAMGGIADAARIVANQGRRGDTMLAHINPQEARLLKALGGAGTINPRTGLPEYGPKWLRKAGDAVGLDKAKAVVDDFVSDARDFVRSDIGGIITQIGLTIVLGPIMGPAFAAATAAGATTAMRGGDLKDVAKSALLAGTTAYLSAPGSPVHNFVGKYTPAFMNNPTVVSALTAQVVGTGAGLLQGQSLSDAAKNGFRDAAITGAATYVSGGSKAQVDEAASNSVANATDAQLQKGAAAAPKGDTLEFETPRVKNIAEVDAAALAENQVAAASDPDLVRAIAKGEITPAQANAIQAADNAAGVSTPGAPNQIQTRSALPKVDETIYRSNRNIPSSLDVVNLQDATPNTAAILPGQGDYLETNLSGLDESRRAAVSGLSLGNTTFGDISPMSAADAATGTPAGGIGSLKKVPTVMESLGKIAKGDVLEGAGDLFMPSGPSTKDIIDSPEFAQLTKPKPQGGAGLSGDAALKVLQESPEYNPGFMRTYGPTAAAGIAGLALAGGFGAPEDPEKTQEQQEYEDRMRMSTTEFMAQDPSRYYLQNVPGVAYGERGEVIGSTATRPTYSTADITGGTFSPYSQFNNRPLPSAFMSPYGARYLNQGGIATLRAGGYPRRTGQISGPGTETSDDIPAMLSDGEFVMTARAVRGMGNGSRREGARKMYALMHKLENNAARG